LEAGKRRARVGQRLRPMRGWRRQLAQLQVVDLDRPATTTATGTDNELDLVGLAQRSVLRRAPRKRNLTFLDGDPLPFAWNLEILALEPPDIVAAGVGELDLEVVRRSIPAQIKRNLVVVGKLQRQVATDEGVARGLGEIEIEAQRLAANAGRHRG